MFKMFAKSALVKLLRKVKGTLNMLRFNAVGIENSLVCSTYPNWVSRQNLLILRLGLVDRFCLTSYALATTMNDS